MAQILRPESIGTLTRVSNTQLTVGPSLAIIGGQQRQTAQYTIATSTTGLNGLDTGAISSNQFYYVYLVVSAGVLGAVMSLSDSGPTGFPAYRLVGQCTTDGSSNLVAANKTMEDNSPIGHVMPAMLTESQFKAVHGNGWVLAAGQSVAGSKYAFLTGLTTAPDLRGRTIAGVDDMGGSAANRLTPGGSGITGTTLGATGGAETHTLTTAQLASHQHFTMAENNSAVNTGGTLDDTVTASNYVVSTNISSSFSPNYAMVGSATVANEGLTSATGTGAAHQNTQPTIVMNYFIKIN